MGFGFEELPPSTVQVGEFGTLVLRFGPNLDGFGIRSHRNYASNGVGEEPRLPRYLTLKPQKQVHYGLS